MPIERIDPVLTGSISPVGSVTGTISGSHGVSGTITVGGSETLPEYEGPYTVTPGATEQTLETADHALTANIVIEAVPQNYGLITWNGSYLTVS